MSSFLENFSSFALIKYYRLSVLIQNLDQADNLLYTQHQAGHPGLSETDMKIAKKDSYPYSFYKQKKWKKYKKTWLILTKITGLTQHVLAVFKYCNHLWLFSKFVFKETVSRAKFIKGVSRRPENYQSFQSTHLYM